MAAPSAPRPGACGWGADQPLRHRGPAFYPHQPSLGWARAASSGSGRRESHGDSARPGKRPSDSWAACPSGGRRGETLSRLRPGVPWRGGSKRGGPRRPAQNRARRSACSVPALDPLAWCRRLQRRRQQVSETSEQETDTQRRVVTRPRSLSDAVVQKGLANFPWYPGAE